MKTLEAENLRFFNTLTRTKEKFVPIEGGKVKMYTCGPTVYDYSHIGNFRAFLFEDLLRRWLEYRGFKVTQVMNLTDVDDKTIRGSREEGVPLNEYTERYVKAFFEDVTRLNIQKAEYYPRATEHVPEMVSLIKKLFEKGYAYRGKDGSVYYEISKFKDYGRLARIKVEELKVGARVKADEYAKEEAQILPSGKLGTNRTAPFSGRQRLARGDPGGTSSARRCR